MPEQDNLYIPAHAEPFGHRLVHFARNVAGDGALKIVALGSSSTAGEGDIVPYTYRLQAALRNKYPGRMVDVLNRGVIGQEAPDELERMQKDVLEERPSLLVWQVGTNAVWQRGRDSRVTAAAIVEGLERLSSCELDVVLMDLQYVPALLTDDKIDGTRYMMSAITGAAASQSINVFGRFEFMRKLVEVEKAAFDRIIDPNDEKRLHQSDWAAQRIGYELSEAIAVASA
ncbi:lysophospholipase L1-like esterase [Nitrobacteraceae bacterium AZCC 2146]